MVDFIGFVVGDLALYVPVKGVVVEAVHLYVTATVEVFVHLLVVNVPDSNPSEKKPTVPPCDKPGDGSRI